MHAHGDFYSYLRTRGVSRRGFLKYCAGLVSLLALPGSATGRVAEALAGRRMPLVWLSLQACTGCTESLLRSYAPSVDTLILDYFSLDYHHTLQAAAGDAAEAARSAALTDGGYLLVVDGSVSSGQHLNCSTIAGRSGMEVLAETVEQAAAVIAVGSCAAFGGLPAANPNPTTALAVEQLMAQGSIPRRPLVNVPGCPPLPEAITGTLAHFIAFGRLPALDALARPLSIYGRTLHDRCSRIHFFYAGQFAESFDDEGARKGWCLYKLGCRGPTTHNACMTQKWNGGTSSPVDAGHPCIGCSEPDFWDAGGFYRQKLSTGPDVSTTEEASRGRALFDDQCVYCHEPDATDLSVEPTELRATYERRGGRAHRAELSDEEWSELMKFLETTR